MKRPDQIKTAPDQGYGQRVPPGQFVTTKFPVLTYGPEPKVDINAWTIRVFGLVEQEITLDWQQFAALPWQALDADFHCVTQWSALDQTWEGVALSDLLERAGVSPDCQVRHGSLLSATTPPTSRWTSPWARVSWPTSRVASPSGRVTAGPCA